MGDPKFPRKKYETPTHPWQGARIKEEAEVVKKYGLKNKREVWKAETLLRNLRGQARNLQAQEGSEFAQAERETKQLLGRLHRMGILQDDAHLDDVLALNVEAVLNRRLQTQVYLKGLASTPQQARQLIVHGHVSIGGGRVTIPGYLVSRAEEPAVEYAAGSPLQDPDHPVRPNVELTTGPAGDGGAEDAADEDIDEDAAEESVEAAQEEEAGPEDAEGEAPTEAITAGESTDADADDAADAADGAEADGDADEETEGGE